MRQLFVDISPLRRFRQYRLLFTGNAISQLGRQLTIVAAPVQVFEMTGSTLAVGALGLAQVPALLVGSLLGGVLADSVDRRRVMSIAQVVLAALALGLAINAMAPEPALWPIYVLTAGIAGASGVDQPTRSASIPRLVPARDLQTALALQAAMFQVSAVVGPSIAGLLIVEVSLASAYVIDAITFGAALITLLIMEPIVPRRPTGERRPSVFSGIRFLKGRQAIQGVYVVDLNAMIFGMPRALFPEFGTLVLGGNAATVGLLYAAPGAGALVGALLSGWIPRVERAGRAVLMAVAVWGAAIAVFGVSPGLTVALVALAVAGAADVISSVFRNTVLQLSVPDAMRGRMSALQIAVVTGGPRLGDAEAGLVASVWGVRASAWSGGLASMVGVGIVAATMPAFRDWTRPADPQ